MKLGKKKSDVVKDVTNDSKASKKEVKASADSPKSAANGKSLKSWVLQPVLLSVVIVVALVVAFELVFISKLEQKLNDVVKESTVASIKVRLDSYLSDRELLVRNLASGLKQADLSDDYLAATQATVSSVFDDLSAFYVLPNNQLETVNDVYPDLSFASLDLIRKAATGKNSKLDAFFQDKNWSFQVAASSEAGENGVTVLALFNMNRINALLSADASAPAGKSSLQKKQGNADILSKGQAGGNDALSLATKVPQWLVSFDLAESSKITIDRFIVWIISASAIVVLALGIFVMIRQRMVKLVQDLMLATQNLKSAVSNEGKKAKGITYSEVSSLVSIVSQAAKSQLKVMDQKVKAESEKAKSSSTESSEVDPLFEDDLLDLDVLADSSGQRDPLEKDVNTESELEGMVTEVASLDLDVPQSIFRAYDIRGIVDETLNEGIVELLGKAIASDAIALGQTKLCVGYDGRLSSVPYCNALTRGIVSTGVDAIVIGQVPTPVLYFATHHFETGSGVMITGSHNPGNYNGFKMMLAGNTLSGDDIQKLYNRIMMQDFAEGQGSVSEQAVDREYLDHILNDIAVAAPLKVVVDAGNGVAGELAPALIEELGCEVIPLYCDIDGSFPNHHPDPGKPENLQDLIAAVKEHDADVGLAFDGDGDRVGVVTNTGKIIWPDRLLMLFAKDVVSRNPGADIIYDVKCSRRLNGLITSYGGRPVMWKTGHSLIKAKMKESGALLAGEMSGHIFFKERWFGFDDGLYSAARLLEILGIEPQSSDEVFATFPEDISTPEINVTVTDESKFMIVGKLCELKGNFSGGNVSTIDGLRVDYPNGWGLCRASNTTPVLVLRFEADDEASLEEIKEKFKEQLKVVDPTLALDF